VKLPFLITIPKAARDPDVKRVLTDPDRGGPAVLAWMLQGCEKWRRFGLIPPSVVEVATQELRDSQDPLREFLEERCKLCEGAFVPVTKMRKAYEAYAEDEGIRHLLGPHEFNRRLEARGCQRKTKRYYNDNRTEKVAKCWLNVELSTGREYEECDTESPHCNRNEAEDDLNLPF
jgi:putative DNA primase/helicase